MNRVKMSLLVAIAVAATATSTHVGTLESILSNPKLNIELRPRYEYIVDPEKHKESLILELSK